MSRRGNDEGVVIVLVALLMIAVLICVGIVIDLGQLREDRQSNKRVADSAAAAATFDLQSGPWRAVCTAYEYVLANADGFSSFDAETWSDAAATPTTVSSTPGACPSSAPYGAPCVTDDPSTWARFQGTARSGEIAVTISSGYTLPDPAFAEDASISGDNGEPCDQVAVVIREQRTPAFGRLAGVDRQQTTMRTVGRITPGESQVAALVVLDRTACRAIDASTNGGKLVVHASGDTPGSISVDSDGSACGAGGQKVVEGSPLPSVGGPNIIAEKTTTSPVKSGRISIFALGLNAGVANSTACDYPVPPATAPVSCSIMPRPVRAPVRITREFLDQRYLTAVRSKIATARSTLSAMPGTFTRLSTIPGVGTSGGGASCDVSGAVTVSQQNVYIDCDLTVKNGAVLRFTAAGATIVAKGSITVAGNAGGGGTFAADSPTAIYVGGSTSGAHPIGIDITGSFVVNDAGTGACPTPTVGTTATNVLVVRDGSLSVNGGSSAKLRLCQTSVLMANGWQSAPGPPSAWPTSAAVAPPYDNSFTGKVEIKGQGSVDWTAPNALPGLPATQVDWDRLEDLTLWTETSDESTVGGQGAMHLAGVFALPNAAPFTLSGTGAQAIDADAQFWTRRLSLSGQALLEMAPNPNDSVPTIDFSLVR